MAFFCFPNHTMKLKTPVNKVQGKKVFWFWHVMLHSYLCNALCKFFIKVDSNWCFSKIYSEIKSTWPTNSRKEKIVLSRDGKELFVQRFVKVFHQNRIHVEARNQRTYTPTQVFSCKYCKTFNTTYFEKHLQTAAL